MDEARAALRRFREITDQTPEQMVQALHRDEQRQLIRDGIALAEGA